MSALYVLWIDNSGLTNRFGELRDRLLKVVFRTNYPASKVVAGFLRGRGGQDLSKEIEQLGVGTAYVSTPAGAEKYIHPGHRQFDCQHTILSSSTSPHAPHRQ